ncbi:hypothetical protein [Nostoc favosum]|uniref:Uncharacterized protein n=1 Tax=Nostoc favosum CHAB5714 TaxID=2780399 RepID=A0ABS8IA47_9NOSO|nr:hypothetical protein [Nostoc favosum]MCC5600736.1 hypothetical protein [Nostoc favosum CHAB5714]
MTILQVVDKEFSPVPVIDISTLNDIVVNDDKSDRWDKASVHEFRGTYGDYLLNKVSKVFPELRQTVF